MKLVSSIKKIDQTESVSICNRFVQYFGVSFHISYKSFEIEKGKTQFVVEYEIKLIENTNHVFGVVLCVYEFVLEVDYAKISEDEFLEEQHLRRCLKENHNEIIQTVETVLSKHKIIYESHSFLLS